MDGGFSSLGIPLGRPGIRRIEIEVVERDGVLRISWDNRRVAKDNYLAIALGLFWIIWAPITVMVTVALCRGEGNTCFFSLWLVGGWFGTAIPYLMLKRWWSEWIEISVAGITLGARGFLAPRPKIFIPEEVRMIALGSDSSDGHRFLNVCGKHRVVSESETFFGYWLSEPLKREVFEIIRKFVVAKRLPYDVVCFVWPLTASDE